MSDYVLISVIIPVFNKQDYLERCLRSLVEQSCDHASMEAIFINDGSTDNSLTILKQYEKQYPWVNVLSQDNSGVCSARNAGINAARGRFLFYLDPDDELAKRTLEDVSAFFEDNYNEVDLVTYPIIPIVDGKRKTPHYRYNILNRSAVYDLNKGENCYICQTTMNVCVKNEFSDNTYFIFNSFNGKIFHEDQAYITEVLLRKMKIGYCETGQYLWNQNADSVSSDLVNSYNLFENTTSMYENLFDRFEEKIPLYIQCLLVNDMGWKMRQNALLPNHLKGQAYDIALERLSKLINRIDDDIFLSHPNMHKYHAYFFINLKSSEPIIARIGPNAQALLRNERLLYVGEKIEVILTRTRVHDNGIDLFGFIKSPVFKFYDGTIELIAIKKNSSMITEEIIELTDSSWSRCGCNSVTARFFDFRFRINFENDVDITFEVRFNGTPVRCYFSCYPKSNFSKELHNTVLNNGIEIAISEGATVFHIKRLTQKLFAQKNSELVKNLDFDVRLMRRTANKLLKWKKDYRKEIWIYTDSPGKVDNAWLQFTHDAHKKDGVIRFYIANKTKPNSAFLKGLSAWIIPFRSRLNKLLFIGADKLLCSDASQNCVQPFGNKARKHYADLINAETIYLQHGVLWAHLPWYYSFDRILFDSVVVSTHFEMDNLISNYGFRSPDLLGCGMARYDHINNDSIPQKKILVCPSWRAYLVGALTNTGRLPMREKFLKSDYYKGFSTLLSDGNLIRLLNIYDYEIHFKLHPLFECYSDLFTFNSTRISFAPATINEADYTLAVTDYSSYSFDFVYLKRSLIYYIPDEELFFNGINHYQKLDIDLDEAFGEHAKTAEDTVRAIERILINDGKALPSYSDKEDDFFLHYDNNQTDRLYEILKGNN